MGRVHGLRRVLRRHGGAGARHPAPPTDPSARAGVHIGGWAGGSSYPLQELLDLEPDERATRQMELLDTRWDAAVAQREPRPRGDDQQPHGSRSMPRRRGSPAPACRRGGLSNQLEARAHHDTSDRLGAITCPTLVCGGRYDGIAPPANSEFLADAIPHARLALFDGGTPVLAAGPDVDAGGDVLLDGEPPRPSSARRGRAAAGVA